MLSLASPFGDLAELWLVDLESRGLAANTKENYRDDLRVHVRPFFEHYTLGEVTTGRVEGFLKAEGAVSYSRGQALPQHPQSDVRLRAALRRLAEEPA